MWMPITGMPRLVPSTSVSSCAYSVVHAGKGGGVCSFFV
jgi:hypothetical protein